MSSFRIAKPAALLLLAACLTDIPQVRAAEPAPPSPQVAAPAPTPFVRADADQAVTELARQIEDNFVFPDVARQYAAMLRANLAAGKYSSFPNSLSLAKAVTADLQAIHQDRHLAMRPPRVGAAAKRAIDDLGDASGIEKSGWLADGVAYIDFTLFPGNEATLSQLRAFLVSHENAKTLIIDARNHHGGDLAEMGLMFPYLYAKPTVLVDMDTRAAAIAHDRPEPGEDAYVRTIAAPPGIVRREHFVTPASVPDPLQQAKVFLLVSKHTGSAGEHLALSLKRTHRATLVGETTYGAGHYGSFVDLGHGYTAFIPVGRTFDPDNGQEWEGIGVKPDVEVPAEQALNTALRLAGVQETGEKALANLH